MSKTLQNSIWPNTDGKLGTIKTEIPDGTTNPWPEGDALIGKFVYKNDRLVGFVDTKALTLNSSKKTTINYDYTEISLPCISEGDLTITRGSRSKYFKVKWGTTVETEPDIPQVELQPDAIWKPTSITSSNVSKLNNVSEVQSYYMVKNGLNYGVDLSGVTAIDAKIIPSSVKIWNCNLPALTEITNDEDQNAYGKHIYPKLFTNLESFTGDLSSLSVAAALFMDNNNLTHFSGDLSGLRCGYAHNGAVADFQSSNNDIGMFINTDLTVSALQNVANALPDRATTPSTMAAAPEYKDNPEDQYWHTLYDWKIGISWHSNAKNKTSANKQQILNIFSQIVAKGWEIYTNSDLVGSVSGVHTHVEKY